MGRDKVAPLYKKGQSRSLKRGNGKLQIGLGKGELFREWFFDWGSLYRMLRAVILLSRKI